MEGSSRFGLSSLFERFRAGGGTSQEQEKDYVGQVSLGSRIEGMYGPTQTFDILKNVKMSIDGKRPENLLKVIRSHERNRIGELDYYLFDEGNYSTTTDDPEEPGDTTAMDMKVRLLTKEELKELGIKN